MILPAISLWQPYASAIALGLKQIETRHWRLPDKFISERVAIHAAQRRDAETFAYIYDVCLHDELREKGYSNWNQLPFGALVATAVFDRCVRIDQEFRNRLFGNEILWGNYADGRFAWILKDVQPLKEPIPCKGRQGFFKVEIPESEEAK